MDFSFNDSEAQLRASLQRYLTRHNSFANIVACRDSGGFDARIWKDLAHELGILGLLAPERCGGLDGSMTALLVVMDELGYALVQVPYLDVAVTATTLLRDSTPDSDALLSAIIEGRETCVAALPADEASWPVVKSTGDGWLLSGAVATVLNGPIATRILVPVQQPHGPGLIGLDTATLGNRVRGYPTIDGRSACDIDFDGLVVPEAALVSDNVDLPVTVAAVRALAKAALGAEAIGVMRRMLVDTRTFCLERHQFGQPIAAFQVLQHRLVDMYLQFELATSAVYRAMLSIGGAREERDIALGAMGITVAEGLAYIGQNAIQLHGGMGMTDEMPISHYFRRATAIGLELGSLEENICAFAALRSEARNTAAMAATDNGEAR